MPEIEQLPELSANELNDIRAQLAGPIFWCSFTRPIAQRYALQRQADFAMLTRIGWPLLLFAEAVILVLALLTVRSELQGADGQLWWKGAALEALVILLGIRLALHPRLLPHYQIVIALVAAPCLTIPLLGTMLFESEQLRQIMGYVSLGVIIIQVLAMRLPPPAGALCVAQGLAWTLVCIWLFSLTPDWLMLGWLIAGGLTIILFVAAVLERQERIGFLQSLLLQSESVERERLNRELDKLARQDGLTGLANRRQFDLAIVQEWERMHREGKPLTVVLLDIDHFKRYNDSCGHTAGDACLVAIAAVLQRAGRRPADLAARYGGEEFVLLLPSTDEAGAREVAERILAEIDRLAIPHPASPVATHVTASIGLATRAPQEGGSPEELLEATDHALYGAKYAGRHRAFDEREAEAVV